jgi:hypothetical protein
MVLGRVLSFNNYIKKILPAIGVFQLLFRVSKKWHLASYKLKIAIFNS